MFYSVFKPFSVQKMFGFFDFMYVFSIFAKNKVKLIR